MEERFDHRRDGIVGFCKGTCKMLVLSRKIGESIQIAGGIRVTVTEVRGGRVRLSIEAPSDVRVLRKEIADVVARQTQPGFPADSDR